MNIEESFTEKLWLNWQQCIKKKYSQALAKWRQRDGELGLYHQIYGIK